MTLTVPVTVLGELSSWDLVTAAQEGDREALGELYRRYRGSVFGFVAPGVDEEVVRRETVEEIRVLIARLPKRYQKYITLRYLGDFSVRQTARVLGCREGTVKSGTSRAIRDLRNLAAEEGVA
jgi:RNA polymerase sigma factor (sigma-70 family)